jgi:Ca2+-binding RTX toxin-like protein
VFISLFLACIVNATSKLVKAWESKNAKNAAKAGGISLMALSLAACGGSSDTVDITSDNAAAIVTALTTTAGVTHATVDAAVAAGIASVDITSDNAALIAAAVAAVDTTTDDATAVSLALRNAAADAGVTGTSTMTNAELITAIKTANDASIAAGVDLTTDNAAAIDAAVVALGLSGISTLAQLNTAYGLLVDPAAATYTLTANTDAGASFTGGSGDDTFVGTLATLTSGDSLDGAGGIDVVNVTATLTAAASESGFTLSNIETLNVSVDDGDTTAAHVLTVNTLNAGVDTLLVSGASTTTQSDGVTFTNVAAGTDLKVTASNVDTTMTYVAAATSGTNDSANVTFEGAVATAAADAVVSYGATSGIETLNIVSQGSASTVGDVIFGGTTANISGDANLTIRSALDTTTATIDANGFTGNLSVIAGNTGPAAAVAGVDVADITVIGGSGDDSLSVANADAADEISVSGGDGADTITIGNALATSSATVVADIIDGGAGEDTLVATSALMNGMAAANTTGVSNLEALQVSDALAASMTTANVQTGIDTVKLAAGANAGTIVFEAGSNDVTIGAANAGLLTLTDTGTATDDSVTISNSATTAVDMFNGNALTVTGLETLNIVSTAVGSTSLDLGIITMTADTGGTSTVNFSGSDIVTTTGTITADVINASGLTAADTGSTFTMSAAATTVTTITGSEGADTLRGDASSTIHGGGGNDTIVGGSGNDTLNGDAGDDSITTGAGNDTVAGGDGNDTIVFAGSLATSDVIDGGDGTADNVQITNASLTTLSGYGVSAANALNTAITNVERFEITDAFNSGTAFDIGRLDATSYLKITGITGDESLTGFASGATLEDSAADNATTDILTLGVTGAATGSSDVLNVVLSASANTDYGVTAIADVETINIDSTEGTASATVRAGTIGLTITQQASPNNNAQTVNFTGTESLTVDTAIAAGTISAAGMTVAAVTDAGLTMSTAHTAAQTITGSGKVDTLYGSTKADTINAGAGADTIYGGTGGDIIDGGDGLDTYRDDGALTAAAVEGTGTGTSTGVVVNLSSAAITNSTVLATTSQDLSGSLTSVEAGKVAYVFNGSAVVNTTVTDTLSNIENVTLFDGINYIVGSDAANVITGGTGTDWITSGNGADTITGGAGNDTVNLTETTAAVDTLYLGTAASSTVMSASNDLSASGAFASSAVIAAGDTFTFGSGVDIVSGFGATDTIDATTAGAATSALLAYDTDLVAGTSYIMYGTYATGVFTAAAAFNASTAKDALYVEGDAGSLTFLTTTGYVVLDDLTAAIGASNIV